MPTIYLIADLHFGSKSIIRYENRPFKNVVEMDSCLIGNWNATVSEEDSVYVLGDFSFYSEEQDQEILSKLKGNKILIMGNHDTHRTPAQWRNLGFSECSPWPIILNEFFILSHEPMYINTNMPYGNFYGHIHSNSSYKNVSKQSACVCVERIHYTPVSLECLIKQMKEENI